MDFTPEQKRTARQSTRPGIGPVAVSVIRLIHNGHNSGRKLVRRLMGSTAADQVQQIIDGMVADGYLHRRASFYFLTEKSRQFAPGANAAPVTTPYRAPVAPPRRPGSDHSHIPSMAGGHEFQHGHPI